MSEIIHICTDEKFINSAYQQFEELYPGQNMFYVYGMENKEIKHIKWSNSFRSIELTINVFESLRHAVVIFHSMPNMLIPFLQYIHPSNKVVWLLFGFETYHDRLLYSENILLDSITKKKFGAKTQRYSTREHVKTILFPLVRMIKKDLYFTQIERNRRKVTDKRNALKRVDFIGTSFEDEYRSQLQLLKFKKPFFYFWYYPLEKIVDINQPIVLDKNTIMIGHSGFPSGNHLDVIKKIEKYKLSDSNILIPFSYGDQSYMKEVKPQLISFRSDITFLEDFMSLESYNKLLNHVKIAILNNRRQQAVGNIIALLYFGAKVFLSEENTFYRFLKSKKILVFNYEKELNNNTIQKGLTLEEIEYNRMELFTLFNAGKLKSELQKSINTVLQ